MILETVKANGTFGSDFGVRPIGMKNYHYENIMIREKHLI